jgi:glycosyltransferase involved in cell wall biosynthesis
MFWKRGQRGMRLYYLLWQFAALREARRLMHAVPFDCVFHLTIANAWIGSTAALTGLPFVYGPVGAGVKPPLRLVPSLGIRGVAYESVRYVARVAARYLNPLARISWRRAHVILAQNHETIEWFPKSMSAKACIFQNAMVEELPVRSSQRKTTDGKTAMLAARLVPWKGVSLAIEAVAASPDWRLLIFGTGPDESRLRRLAARLDVQDRVEFRGHVTRSELQHIMTSVADVFFFPSLHDDASLAVTEAVAAGLPVVCLDVGGPPLVAGEAGTNVTARGGRQRVVRGLRAGLEAACSKGPVSDAARDRLLLERRAEYLRSMLGEVLGS